jgi:hypothetical protein
VNFFDFSFWQSFLSNLLATIIGVGLGIPVALLINRWVESKTEKERKKKILSVLRVELMENFTVLRGWVNEGKKKVDVLQLTATLKDESWSAFSEGGELEWIKDPYLLSELSDAFSTIRSIKLLADRYFKLIEFPTDETSGIASNTVWRLLDAAVTYAFKEIPTALDFIEKSFKYDNFGLI